MSKWLRTSQGCHCCAGCRYLQIDLQGGICLKANDVIAAHGKETMDTWIENFVADNECTFFVSSYGEKKPPIRLTKETMMGKWLQRKADQVPGGLAAGEPDEVFDPEQLAKGIQVELEHTPDADIAKEIAKDHLMENPKYYDYLETMEKAFEAEVYELPVAAWMQAYDHRKKRG